MHACMSHIIIATKVSFSLTLCPNLGWELGLILGASNCTDSSVLKLAMH